MRIRDLAVTATLIPVLMLAGCAGGESADVAASSPGAQKASKHNDVPVGAAQPEAPPASDDPVVNAYYDYRAALDTMMKSGGKATKQLAPVMTPRLYKAYSQQAKYYRARKLRNTGATKVIWAKRTIAASGVIIRACYDTKAARTVDAKGRGVIPAKSPTRWIDEMRVEQRDGRWVVDGGSTTAKKC